MVEHAEYCQLCGMKMRMVGTKVVSETTYFIYECDKCHRQAAKSYA